MLTYSARRRAVTLTITAVGVLAAVAASLVVGASNIRPGVVLDALLRYDRTDPDHVVVRAMRVPRTLLGMLAGAALGTAGTVMQGVARNPLADPGLLGVNAGAALFVVLGIHLAGIGGATAVWLAMLGAALASLVVHLAGATARGSVAPVRLALTGAAVTALLTSITSAVLLTDSAALDQYRFWSVGSLSGRDLSVVRQVAPFILAGLVLAAASASSLDAMALGDDVARGLGHHPTRQRVLVGFAIALLAGAATAGVGPIAFVGLAVPHLARRLAGSDHRWLLAHAALLAPTLLLTADVIGRLVTPPGELQVGIVTAAIGAPLFIALVRRRPVTA